MSRVLDTLITYRILRMLTTPFDQTDAHRLGIIDARGNVLKSEAQLNTAEEQEAYTLLNRMVFRLKKILEKVPVANKQFLSFAAAVALVRENVEYDEDILEELFYMNMEDPEIIKESQRLEEGNILSFKDFVTEEGMGVAGGAIAGIGISHPTKVNQAEPGITKSRQKKYKKDNTEGSPVMIRRK
jgi:hypothetical protein